MFCKNCGKEIDQKTLHRLMQPTGETVVCSKCRQPLDNPEFCGGFWGLIAASREMEAESRDAGSFAAMPEESGRPAGRQAGRSRTSIPGATEADLTVARMLLEQEGRDPGTDSQTRQGTRRQSSPGAAFGGGPERAGAGQRAGGMDPPRRRGRRNKGAGSIYKWTALAAVLVVAAVVLLLVLPGVGKGKKTEDADAAPNARQKSETAPAGEPSGKTDAEASGVPDREPADTIGAPAQLSEDTGSDREKSGTAGPESVSAAEARGYNLLRRHYENGHEIALFYHDEQEIRIGDEKSQRSGEKGGTDDSNVDAAELFDCIGAAVDGSDRSVVSVTRDEDHGNWYEKYWEMPDRTLREQEYKFDEKKGTLTQKEIRVDEHDVTVSVENRDRIVTERYSESMHGTGVDGKMMEYQAVEKEYDRENRLVRVAYYETEEDLEAGRSIAEDYRRYTPEDYPNPEEKTAESLQLSEDLNQYYYRDERFYTEPDGDSVSVGSGQGEYDRIRYIFEGTAGRGRLAAMAYYLKEELTEGPDGFAYFTCSYEETGADPSDAFETMEREDRFYDREGNRVSINSVEPFFAEDSSIVPGYYSRLFPEFAGLSAEPAQEAAPETRMDENEDSGTDWSGAQDWLQNQNGGENGQIY